MSTPIQLPPPASLSSVRWLAPVSATAETFWASLQSNIGRIEPFSGHRLAVLEQLSQAIFQHPLLRREPATAALAYWLRAANLASLRLQWQKRTPEGSVQVPAGLVFHITPTNVDTMFVYSWAISFLAGNTNVVRLSAESGELLTSLVRLIDETMRSNPGSWAGNFFLTYPHDESITALFSRYCDHRIIWGGDETVARIRAVPLNPHASERAFASKFSCAVIGVEALAQSSSQTQNDLAERLASDIVPFGQKACSSPHLIYWLTDDLEPAKDLVLRFEQLLTRVLAKGLSSQDTAAAVHRIHQAFTLAADNLGGNAHFLEGLTTLRASSIFDSQRLDVGGSFLTHRFVTQLSEVTAETNPRTQTISHYGLTDQQLHWLAMEAGSRGCDRLMPIGRALEFSPLWDGFDLWNDFCRIIPVSK